MNKCWFYIGACWLCRRVRFALTFFLPFPLLIHITILSVNIFIFYFVILSRKTTFVQSAEVCQLPKKNKAQVMHVFKLYVRIMGLIICQLMNTCGIFWPHIILIFEYPTVIYIYLNAELPSCIERFLGLLTIYEEVRSNIWRLMYSCAYFLPFVFLV